MLGSAVVSALEKSSIETLEAQGPAAQQPAAAAAARQCPSRQGPGQDRKRDEALTCTCRPRRPDHGPPDDGGRRLSPNLRQLSRRRGRRHPLSDSRSLTIVTVEV